MNLLNKKNTYWNEHYHWRDVNNAEVSYKKIQECFLFNVFN